jgi:cell wall-associated NlpC family hydrolase
MADTAEVMTGMRRCRHDAALVLGLAGIVAAGCASTPAPAASPSPFPLAPVTAHTREAVSPAARAAALLDTAMALRGTRYHAGGDTPASGFDCSGFVHYVFRQQAIDLPRTVSDLVTVGHRVARGDIRPGDLVFFHTTGKGPSHVGIAVDGTQFVHAPDNGAVVRVERLDAQYWKQRYAGTRRVL